MTARVEIIPEQYPGAGLLFDLGSEKPTPLPNTGIAKYNTIQRPRRRDLSEFQSEEPLKITFSVIMDEWATDGDLGDAYRRVYGWGARNSLPVMPTVLRTKGPIPFSNLRWIMTGIEQVEVRQRLSDYAPSYFELKLELTEWNDIDLISQGLPPAPAESPAKTALQKFQDNYQTNVTDVGKIKIVFGEQPNPRPQAPVPAPPKTRTYTARQGDTLVGIAARELGSGQRWQEIANLNSLRDPRLVKVGAVLKLPV